VNAFEYRDGALYAEDVPVSELAGQYGTPLYVYSRNHLRSQYQALADAMAPVNPLICYSVKANSNATVIKTFLEQGSGFDIVSGGELFRCLRAGADASKIVFAGVGKTVEDIEYALKENILFFTVESEPEAVRISECASRLGTTGRVAFRVNPDVDPQTHKYISTGKKENKFGLDIEATARACEKAAALPAIDVVGLHMHIGSQILSAQPFAEALTKVRDLCLDLKAGGTVLKYLDIGGGLGIVYEPGQKQLMPSEFAEAVVPMLRELNLSVVMEPGRNLVGNAGLLVCRVQYVKKNAQKRFVIVDAGMNDLIRPSLYDAHHEVVPVTEAEVAGTADVVGPVCESGDFIALDRELADVSQGDLLATRSAGAYGFTMASNYNSRPRPAEVMVDGPDSFVVRQRETWDSLVTGEA
jgi:diaminopimelate decarboxylase